MVKPKKCLQWTFLTLLVLELFRSEKGVSVFDRWNDLLEIDRNEAIQGLSGAMTCLMAANISLIPIIYSLSPSPFCRHIYFSRPPLSLSHSNDITRCLPTSPSMSLCLTLSHINDTTKCMLPLIKQLKNTKERIILAKKIILLAFNRYKAQEPLMVGGYWMSRV